MWLRIKGRDLILRWGQMFDPVAHANIAINAVIPKPLKAASLNGVPTLKIIAQNADGRISEIESSDVAAYVFPKEPFIHPPALQINQTIDLGLYDLKVSRDPRAAEIQIACRLKSITQKNICTNSHRIAPQRCSVRILEMPACAIKLPCDLRSNKVHFPQSFEVIAQKNICAHSHPVTMQRSPFNVLKMPAITSKLPRDLCTSKVYACLRAKPLTKMNITIAAQAMQNEVCNIGP